MEESVKLIRRKVGILVLGVVGSTTYPPPAMVEDADGVIPAKNEQYTPYQDMLEYFDDFKNDES